jgi:hypothetical protein
MAFQPLVVVGKMLLLVSDACRNSLLPFRMPAGSSFPPNTDRHKHAMLGLKHRQTCHRASQRPSSTDPQASSLAGNRSCSHDAHSSAHGIGSTA